MEIERKFTVKNLPDDLSVYPKKELEQAYISTSPTIRIRKADDKYELTVKGSGMLAHEELNLPLTEEKYRHLMTKTEGRIIKKTRYLIPYGVYTIELDLFHGDHEGLIIAEVEFPTIEEAGNFEAPGFFLHDVTSDPHYYNADLAFRGL